MINIRASFILTSILCALTLYAQQPKGLKKLRAAQVAVLAYTADGSLQQGQGTIISQDGVLVAQYDVMKNATRAIVVDATGTEHPVIEILGANSAYNMVKMRMEMGKKKIAYLNITKQQPGEQAQVFIMPSEKADKSVPCTVDTVTHVDEFGTGFKYLTLTHEASDRQANSPVLDQEGMLIGFVQLATKEGQPSYVIDANYASALDIKVMDAGNTDLNSIRIPKALPEDENEALSFIYLSGKKDTALFMNYINKFIALHPTNTTGYTLKAEQQVQMGQYGQASSTYETAFKQEGIKTDELHYSLSKVIYGLNMSADYQQYEDWNIERALSEAEQADSISPQPTYGLQQAHCLYALKRYDKAGDKFLELTQTNLRTPELFMYAAQCRQKSLADTTQVIALMDSALNCFSKPYPIAAANIILLRAKTLSESGRYREAIAGYNDFEHLSGNNVTANFYYEREQMEVKCRMYAQALNDIEKAIKLAPREPVLHAEAASLNYRVGQNEQAISYAQRAITLSEDFADAHRILGVCLLEKGDKEEAHKHLLRAKELGDNLVDNILKKAE